VRKVRGNSCELDTYELKKGCSSSVEAGLRKGTLTGSDGRKIEARKLGNLGVEFQEEGKGLADATGSTEHGNLEATLGLGSNRAPLKFVPHIYVTHATIKCQFYACCKIRKRLQLAVISAFRLQASRICLARNFEVP